jgi:diguanylate cyclase (GGDEF)-like protein
VFGLLGLAVDEVALPLLGGELPPFRLGGSVVLVAFVRLGPASGLLAALVAFAASLAAGLGGVFLAVVRLLEAWIVARLYRRNGSLVLSAALYWSTLGWVVNVVVFGWWLRLDATAIGLLITCQGFGGIVSAFGAEAALELIERYSRRGVDAPSPRQLGPYAAARFVWTVLAPTLLLALLCARILYHRQMEHARADRREAVGAVAQGMKQLAAPGHPSVEALDAVLERARHEAQEWTLLDEARKIVARADAPRESRAGSPGSSSSLLGRLRLNQGLTVSEAVRPLGLMVVLDEPLLRVQAGTVPSLLLILGLVLLPSVLLHLGVFRLARTLSLSFSRIDLAAREIEAGQLTAATVLEDLARSPIADVRRLGHHYGSLLNALAHYDPLTGLPNRKLLLDRLSVACAQALARRENFALLLVDLDRFRVVDHSLGHLLGNELLRRIARRLKDCVGPADTVARVGGDEFSLLIPRMGGMEDATDTARKVMDIIKRPFILEGREIFVTASVGISLYPRDGQDAETLLKNATAATYVAKEKGQDSYRRYTARITARDAQRLTIESGLRRALEQGGLLVHYQPIVGLQTGQILAAEALVRWDRPDVGIVAACEFISVAEASGLIATIGSWVLRQAIAWP